MLLAYKGRIGFIKDWLLHHGSIWPEFLDLCHHVEENVSLLGLKIVVFLLQVFINYK